MSRDAKDRFQAVCSATPDTSAQIYFELASTGCLRYVPYAQAEGRMEIVSSH